MRGGTASARERLLVGLFVGGQGRRMGGVAKGNLNVASGETVLQRLVRVCRVACPRSATVLVGSAYRYTALDLPAIPDTPAGIGPLGGLRALLIEARRRGCDGALALASDLPYLGAGLIHRLAHEEPDASALGPREHGCWEPLVARYSLHALPAVEAVIADNQRALHRVLTSLGGAAKAMILDPSEQREITDWDYPWDVPGCSSTRSRWLPRRALLL